MKCPIWLMFVAGNQNETRDLVMISLRTLLVE